MRPLRKTIKRASYWYIQVWDRLSGKPQQRFKQLQQTNAELERRLVNAHAQIKTLNQTLELSQQREAQLSQQLDENAVRQARLQQRLTAFKQTETTLKQQLTNTQKRCKTLQQNLDSISQEQQAIVTLAEQSEADLQNSLMETASQCKVLQQEIADLLAYSDQEIQTLENQLENQQSALGNCQVQLGAALATASRTSDESCEPPEVSPTPLSLANWKIALIGGHENTTQRVHQKLLQDYQVQALVEIPSVHMPQQQLKQKLENCDLIVSIVNYSNHALTQSIAQLNNKGALRGELLHVNCRGVSGVMREILSFVQTNRRELE